MCELMRGAGGLGGKPAALSVGVVAGGVPAEWCRAGDAVQVAVGGDGGDGASPPRAVKWVFGFGADRAKPSGLGVDGIVGERIEARPDELVDLPDRVVGVVVGIRLTQEPDNLAGNGRGLGITPAQLRVRVEPGRDALVQNGSEVARWVVGVVK